MPLAATDLIDIWSYIADDSESNADSFINDLSEALHFLAERPGIGRQREELGTAIRSFPFRRYVIFFRETMDAVEIVRVLHGARDAENLLEGQ